MPRVPASHRLTRLLALSAWVTDNPGVSIKEAAEHFGVTPAVIERDVNTLWVSGLPGGLHGDLVDFDAADFDAGRLRLAEPLGLDRPLRLTRQEAISLLLALRVLADLLSDDDASAAVLSSTQRAISALLTTGAPVDDAAARTGFSSGPVADHHDHSGNPGRTAQVLAAVRSALQDKRRLHLAYVSATDTRSERDVDPITLESDGSHMALVAWCLSAKAERSFRLDRIESVQVLDVPAIRHRTSRAKKRHDTSRPEGDRPRATLTLRPTGRWLVEQIPCISQKETTEGGLKVVVEGRDRTWLIGLVLSVGRHLIAVEPDNLAQDAVDAAKQALTWYDTNSEGC